MLLQCVDGEKMDHSHCDPGHSNLMRLLFINVFSQIYQSRDVDSLIFCYYDSFTHGVFSSKDVHFPFLITPVLIS